MSCPHSTIGRPDRCSQCLGAIARRVDTLHGEVFVDGQSAGRISYQADPVGRNYGKRGKAQSVLVTRRRG